MNLLKILKDKRTIGKAQTNVSTTSQQPHKLPYFGGIDMPLRPIYMEIDPYFVWFCPERETTEQRQARRCAKVIHDQTDPRYDASQQVLFISWVTSSVLATGLSRIEVRPSGGRGESERSELMVTEKGELLTRVPPFPEHTD